MYETERTGWSNATYITITDDGVRLDENNEGSGQGQPTGFDPSHHELPFVNSFGCLPLFFHQA